MSDLNSSSARIFASFVADEPDAAAQLFHRYLRRLCRLAQTRFSPRLAERLDPEDVVMSAYRSFFVSARAGRFWIQESGDLWALLTKITLRKLYRSAAHHSAEMRSMQRETAFPEADDPQAWVLSEQPSAADAVALADEVESVLRSLPLQHRRILELRLQGELLNDIARDVGVAERTVRRVLAELEQQLRQKHALPDCETIRVVESPTASPALMRSEKLNRAPVDRHTCLLAFDDLLLTRLIGKGGMGKIYKAVSRSTGQPVAVKFLHKSLQNKPDIVERFLGEAAIVQRLSHPSIIRVEGIGRTNAGVYFIVMELFEGRSLAEEIAAQIPSINDAVKWIIQVAEAMQHAHHAGIMHCDLKPANVLLTQSRNVVVTDFGLARLISDPSQSDTTIAGTAAWMAPEQVDPVFGNVSPRTDVYGLGALLYSMLTGQPPFVGSRVADVLTCVVNQSPAAPGILRPEVPQGLEGLCLECLSKRPTDRPASSHEFLQAMRILPIAE